MAGYKIVLTVKNEKPRVSKETFTKPAAVGGFMLLIKTDDGFDVAHNYRDPAPSKSPIIRHLDGESPARRYFKQIVDRLKAVPKWFVRQGERFVETDERWHPVGTHAAHWKVALGRNGMSERFLTESSWPTKDDARKAAIALLEDGCGLWTSAIAVEAPENPSAARVAARHVARLARSGSGPTDAEWAGIRSVLLSSDDALDEATVFLADKFGSGFAKALLDFVVDRPDLPSEHNFADPAFAEGVFAGAWKNRIDPDGHPIGDQVDVTADAVAELRDRYSTRLP